MQDFRTDGRLQVTAALSLLECSRLVHWNPDSARFTPVHRETFESSWRKVDPVFGRIICWINFSAGAEFLAKGICLLNEIDFRCPHQVPAPPGPNTELHAWAKQFRKDWKSAGKVKTTNFGTLGDLYPALTKLCIAVESTQDEEDLLLASYQLLARSIRNRDAHAYVPNVRGHDFSLVPDLFAKCFNLLVSWLPDGPCILNDWRKDAGQFIAGL